jgi:hypothetical protein
MENIRETNDYKKMITQVVNDYSNKSYFMLEKIVLHILEEHVKKQSKEFYSYYRGPSNNQRFELDAYMPNGYDDINDSTAVEIKMYKSKQNLNRNKEINNLFNKIINLDIEVQNILFIVTLELTESEKAQFIQTHLLPNCNLIIWDLNDLQSLFLLHKDLFTNMYDNVMSLYIKDTISKNISDEDRISIKHNHISALQEEYKKDNLVLCIGAGVSMSAKLPSWNKLISDLFVSLISQQLSSIGVAFKNPYTN